MKHLSSYKVFESIDDKISLIKDSFLDADLEDMGVEVTVEKEHDYIKVNISKINLYQVPSAYPIQKKLEDMLIYPQEYSKIHNIFMGKITYLHEEGIECYNVLYSFMGGDDYKIEFKSLTDYLSKNENMRGLVKFLFEEEKMKSGEMAIRPMACISIYFLA